MAINHEYALEHFHEQIDYVLKNYSDHGYRAADYDNVVIGGLGGSGIGGRLARMAFFSSAPLPIEVFSEYELPAYAGSRSIVILCSYSGNTEETLGMFEDAKKRGCRIICIAAGGQLLEKAKSEKLVFYEIENGFQPRMALGYGFSMQLLVLADLFSTPLHKELEKVSQQLKSEGKALQAKAREIFQLFSASISQKFVVICDMPFEAAAIRFCQQIQENAKGEAFVNVLPEANHNVIESYYEKRDTNFILLNSGLNQRTNLRFRFLQTVLEEHNNSVYNFHVAEFNLWSLFEFIHVTDWLSIFASDAKGVNNMEVGNIAKLKKFLDKA
jgi:glucose/mannose-6-phosphate isomerase